MDGRKPHLTLSPTFGDAGRVTSTVDCNARNESDEEFEFSVDGGSLTNADPADEIFSNGWILPVYPVFDRDLPRSDPDPIEFRSGSTSSTSSAESIDIGAAGNRRTWTPRSAPQSPGRTSEGEGSASKKWRMRDLIGGGGGGRRSRSDGKHKLGFLQSNSKGKEEEEEDRKEGVMDMATAHKLFYGSSGKKKGDEKNGRRRSFLPYRPELVGLFANRRPFNF